VLIFQTHSFTEILMSITHLIYETHPLLYCHIIFKLPQYVFITLKFYYIILNYIKIISIINEICLKKQYNILTILTISRISNSKTNFIISIF